MFEAHTQQIEVRRMEEDIRRIEELVAAKMDAPEKIGKIISRWRMAHGDEFMSRLPKGMPKSFWLECEMIATGHIDKRVAIQPSRKAAELKEVSIERQRDVLDNGVSIGGKQYSIDEITFQQLRDALRGVQADSIVGKPRKVAPKYELTGGKVRVNRSCEFTKDELRMILEAM